MGKKSPKGINTIFRQTGSALRAARQAEVFSRIKRNIPYLVKRVSNREFFKRKRQNLQNTEQKPHRFVKKLTKFAKKIE